MRRMKLEPIIQSEVSQKDKEHYSILTHIYMEFRKMVMITLYSKQKKRHRCTEQTFGLCGRRRGWDVSKEQHVYYLYWNRSPVQVGCMRQVLRPGALGRPRGIRWKGRWERRSGWGIHVTPWMIHVNVWQNPRKCCEVISLQLIKINEKKNKKTEYHQVSWVCRIFYCPNMLAKNVEFIQNSYCSYMTIQYLKILLKSSNLTFLKKKKKLQLKSEERTLKMHKESTIGNKIK